MSNNYRMSYFMPPIAPIKDKQGRLMTPPTLIPFCEVSIEQVFQMITCNENLKTLTAQVRNATDIRAAKASLLPYVTPCGTFTRRSCKDFVSPSHLVIVDVDGLHSYQEAVEMRRMLYDDPLLQDAVRRDGIQYGNSGFFRNEIQSRFLRQRPREILFP